MPIGEQLLGEFEQELATTRRVLERVPREHLGWRAHPTSLTLGQLALHVAGTPGAVAQMMRLDSIEAPKFEHPAPASHAEVMTALDQSAEAVRQILSNADDAWLAEAWSIVHRGEEVMRMPRAGLMRAVGMNHVYHHRGQVAMCLRMLEVPVPVLYGVSGDENPFA
jgi:uncharacterized damage-inducible protein DinB